MHNGKGSFCGGVLCKKSQRKDVCVKCRLHVCGNCHVNDVDKQKRCITCYLLYTPEWDRLNEEFKEMIDSLFNKQKQKETDGVKDYGKKQFSGFVRQPDKTNRSKSVS